MMINLQLFIAAFTVLFVTFSNDVDAAMSKSKLSVHAGGYSSGVQGVVQAYPRLIKLLDDFGPAATIKNTAPGIAIICRIYLPNQPMNSNPSETAQSWFNTHLKSNPSCDYWEGYNEAGNTGQDVAWLSAFDVERTQLLASIGVKSAVGSFATGTPNINNLTEVGLFTPALHAAAQHEGILALHEYAAPEMSSCFSGSVASGSGWLTGRYRKWWNAVMAPQKINITIAMTENGIDAAGCGGPTFSGWKLACGYWKQSVNSTSSCGAEYMRQLAWYDSIMRADDYVLGSTIFQIDCPGWSNYDISSIASELAAYIKSNQYI